MRSLTPADSADPQGGMTLLETMIALAIVAVISGIAVMSIGASDRGQGAETEALRLSARLGLAADMALIDGHDIALQWDEAGYEFTQAQADQAVSPLGGRRDLGPGLRLAGPAAASGRIAISQDSALDAATFVFLSDGQAWRVTFNGLDASAGPMPAGTNLP